MLRRGPRCLDPGGYLSGMFGATRCRRPGVAPTPLELGQPGASLLREHERRRRNREDPTREARPHIAGPVLALGGAPQHESAFEYGALAERVVADSLATGTGSDTVITLHNRRMPGGHGDIDRRRGCADGRVSHGH